MLPDHAAAARNDDGAAHRPHRLARLSLVTDRGRCPRRRHRCRSWCADRSAVVARPPGYATPVHQPSPWRRSASASPSWSAPALIGIVSSLVQPGDRLDPGDESRCWPVASRWPCSGVRRRRRAHQVTIRVSNACCTSDSSAWSVRTSASACSSAACRSPSRRSPSHEVRRASPDRSTASPAWSVCSPDSLYGARRWRIAPETQFVIAFVWLTVSCLPLIAVHSPLAAAFALALPGLAIAPFQTLSAVLTESAVDPRS